MAASNEKLASALEQLRELQHDGTRVFASKQLTRTARERLVKHGFLQEVMKGWLVSASPTSAPGDTTPWFASFWEFCARYCEERFRSEWHLSPEQSLLLHAEQSAIPKQVVIHSPSAGNNRIELPSGTSFFVLRARELPPARDLEVNNGLRLYSLEAALTRAHEDFFARHPVETQVVIRAIREPSRLLFRLLEGGHTTIAGRLAGLFRRLGQFAIADEIVSVMKAADHDVRETDPMTVNCPVVVVTPSTPPIVVRIRTLWASTRDGVLAQFPEPNRSRPDPDAYLKGIDEAYRFDAYHSLSIEGYQVTEELIERVASGAWDPESVDVDRESRNALAARGYWLAFQRVRGAVKSILHDGSASEILRVAHREWYREMFSPHVAVGLLNATMLAGYRSGPVFIRASRHVPPRSGVVGDAMSALFDLIDSEPEASVRAVLGHWLFGYVHPFPDGNGRVARFLMNAVLAGGGYPWTIISADEKTAYLTALEHASIDAEVRPFAKFVAGQMIRTKDLVRGGARRRSPARPARRRAARTRAR